jgi:ribosomal protection tetracycline resistance protein
VQSLNLGILAHVDAGKTSLTERLLLTAGVISELGSVDAGSTQTDSMALERQRGITIRSAVVSFVVGGVTVNLIDTPGHPDFIAEVERVLSVLDGAVLVVSAVEGVQAQTRVLMRTLRRLGIPTLIFVNKTDRRGADPERVYREISARLAAAVKADLSDALETLAEHDDALLAAYVDGTPVPEDTLRQAFAAADVHPVFFGSAITGDGVRELMAGLTTLLPTVSEGDGPVSGTVFKVERGPAGEKIAYVRMFDGTLRLFDRLPQGKVTAISVVGQGTAAEVGAGRIAKLWGLTGVRVGDTIGAPRAGHEHHHFAPPTLETVVTPHRRADKGALHAALTQLAEQDPLINLRQDDVRQEISVSLYGEVQKEVIEATLLAEYGIAVDFQETTTIHIERPAGVGSDVELIGQNPFLATIGLRVEPGRVGSGVEFRLGVELGSMPYAFFAAVEETVHTTLAQGLGQAEPRPRHVREEHVEHRGRLPPPDPAGADVRAGRGGHPGVRADAPVPIGAPRGPLPRGAPRAGPASRGAARHVDHRWGRGGRGRHPGRARARARTAAAHADQRRGGAGERLRPLPGGRGGGAEQAPV